MPLSVVLLTALRALVVAVIALGVGEAWALRTRRSSPLVRQGLRAVWLICWLTPPLLVGYGWGAGLSGPGWQAEFKLVGLMLIRWIPLAALAVEGWPARPHQAEARHAWTLARAAGSPLRASWRLWLSLSDARRRGCLVACLWLTAFQEFELAALTRGVSWSDWLFAAQAGGLPLADSLWAVLLPVICQIAVLGIAWRWLPAWSATERLAPTSPESSNRSGWQQQLAWWSVGLLVLIPGVVWPLLRLVPDLPAGLVLLWNQRSLASWLTAELLPAALVSLLSTLLSWVLLEVVRISSLRLLLVLPGLLGSLTVGLLLVAFFQQPGLRWFYNTPVPWVLGLTLWLLPRAWLVRAWLERVTPSESLHAAELLIAAGDPQRRQWALGRQWRDGAGPRYAALLCLWLLGQGELTLASLLCPTQFTPGIVRLYNFMHYGQSAALSAEALLLVGSPWLLAVVGWWMARSYSCR